MIFGCESEETGMEDELQAVNCAVEQGLAGVGSIVGILP